MAKVNRWSVRGNEIGLKPGLGGVQVLVDGNPVGEKLKYGEMEVPIDGGNVVLRRKKAFAGPVTELLRNGVAIPTSAEKLPFSRAPIGATCANHAGTSAEITCATCGSFACSKCASADGVRCQPCFQKAADKAKRDREVAAYFAPALGYVIFFGLLGALFGAAAGGLSMVVARTALPRWVKISVAVVLYGLAAIVSIVVAALITAKNH